MQNYKLPLIFATIIGIALFFTINLKNKATSTFHNNAKNVTISQVKNMMLSSHSIKNGGEIPEIYTCDGANINPPLTISDPPKGTKSYVIIVDDVDAPSGDFIHWLVWNIAPTTSTVSENSVPQGATEGLNDFGNVGYGGPCPPSGTHKYYFRLYALNSMLNLSKGADKDELNRQILDHVIDHAELMATYKRN